MKVILRANWFVEGRRIRRGNPPSQPVEVPDHLRDKLPTGARIVEEGETVEAPKGPRQAETFTEMVRSRSGRQSMVDLLKATGQIVTPEPEPEPELVHEPEPEDDVLDRARAAAKEPLKRGSKK